MSNINTTTPLASGLNSLTGSPNAVSPQSDAQSLASDDFASIFKSMLVNVDQSQQHAIQLAESFELGQHQDLAGVMIAQQKARLSFQTTLQVRNKMVSAYQDIMNMPI